MFKQANDLACSLNTLKNLADVHSTVVSTDSPEYRRARREVEACNLAHTVLDLLEFMTTHGSSSTAAAMIQRQIADALEQSARDGARLASNAISALKV